MELLNSIDDYIKQKRYRLVNSVLVYKDNELVFERYYNKFNQDSKNNIKSIWKSILSICAGICLDRGYIKSLDEPICNYLQEFNQNIHTYQKLITIRHLLTMTSGIYWNGGIHYHCPMLEQLFRSKNWLEHLADIAMADVPGTKHVYKEWDVILLSAIISKATGMNTYDFCKQYLYQPLGIKSGEWAVSPCGISYTIIAGKEENSDLSARDLAKIGLLFSNNGVWSGTRIVSEGYIKQALTPTKYIIQSLTPTKLDKNYGFLWWLFDDGYACRGYGGQEINVLPKQNLVAVIQATPTSQSKSYGDIFTKIIMKA
jgi:CubicO group peptidase (beta-lactamase class C family)